ncbi:MAG: TIGR03905 family TSCPD domain-containing protein [Clostridia bacterium]|nr:TIGR03905 family TSCPD domain-containing protein [Clostridia bacterium]
MNYTYQTKGTCSKQIEFEIENGVIYNVRFIGGGCNGNQKAVSALVDGLTVEQIEEKCSGIICGSKQTSCANQLAHAVREAYNRI